MYRGCGLGRELFNRITGLLATFIVALSPVSLDYSQDVRPYSLLAFLTAASVYCLLMAEGTGKIGWWVGFVLATSANLLNAYIAVTLVMPAFAPYLAWTLWHAWTRRRERGQGRNMVLILVSFGVVALVGIAILFEVFKMPRMPVVWSKLSLYSPISIADKLQAWFTDAGFAGLAAPVASFFLLLTALLGIVAGIREGHSKGVVLCALFCGVPVLLLAVLATSNITFQRYVLFIGPFYFLLIGNGVAVLLEIEQRLSVSRLQTRFMRVGALTALTLGGTPK